MGTMGEGPTSEAEPEQVMNANRMQGDNVEGVVRPSEVSLDGDRELEDRSLSRNGCVDIERPSGVEQNQDRSLSAGHSRSDVKEGQAYAEVQGSAGRSGKDRWSQDPMRRASSRAAEIQESAETSGRDRWSQDPRRRLPSREVGSSNWRRGKRERKSPEKSAGDEERHWKRRRSEEGRHGSPALPLSPQDLKFMMGTRESPRGSPRNTRRGGPHTPQPQSEDVRRCTLYVGDLDPATTRRDLTGAFKPFGDIDERESKVMTDQCYGFVTFRSRSDAEAALQSESSITILGRRPYISWAQGAMPAWKIGVGGFVIDPTVGIIDKRDALTRAAEAAAATAAAALQAKHRSEEQSRQSGRQLVAYDDLF